MKLLDCWRSISVLGACGNIGRGIALLLLQELAADMAQGLSRAPLLILVDIHPDQCEGLLTYLGVYLRKYAERHLVQLHQWYGSRAFFIDGKEMVNLFVSEALSKVRCETSLESCVESSLVFEAIDEVLEKKLELLQKANTLLHPDAYFLTCSSSIPISFLQEHTFLEGRLVGFHFYNPPVVQKAIELIIPANVEPALHSLAQDIAKRLKKTVVYSQAATGSIGSGILIREIQAACRQVENLQQHSLSLTEALFAVNQVTHNFLIRPKGIFQLIDFVGLETVRNMAANMNLFLTDGPFDEPLIEQMVQQGIKGGQHFDGTQKDGFFHYEQGMPTAIYDSAKRAYVPSSIAEELRIKSQHYIGYPPTEWHSWKELSKDPERKEKIAAYFAQLWQSKTVGAGMALEFLAHRRQLANYLVDQHVANSLADVNTILQEGFFHLYTIEEPFMAFAIAKG